MSRIMMPVGGLQNKTGVVADRSLVSDVPKNWIQEVTPEIARRWLETTQAENNRPLSRYVVRRYMADMATGLWGLSESAICFSKSGWLANGQHRLWAAVESKKSFSSQVLIGLDEDSIKRMDLGRIRNFSQILAMEGVQGHRKLSVATRALAILANAGSKERITGGFLERVYKANEEGLTVALKGLASSGHPKISSGQVIGACAFAYPADKDGIWLFMEGLSTAANLGQNDPALAYRRYLDGRHAPDPHNGALASLTLYAVYRALRGETMEKFAAPRGDAYLRYFRSFHPASYESIA
jgi:hypothetical protein